MPTVIHTRRRILQMAGAGLAARALTAQSVGVRGTSIEHLSVQVSDMQRSLEFYRKLLGMTLVSEDRSKELVRIGYGKRYLISLHRKEPYGLIDHYAIAVDNHDQKAVAGKLAAQGIQAVDGDDAGFHVKDPDGVRVQITTTAVPAAGSGSGVVRVQMLHHVNTQVTNVGTSETFYRNVFGFGPSKRVQGPDNHGLYFPDGGLVILQTSQKPGKLDHFCLGVEKFDADRMRAAANQVFPGKVQGTAKDNFAVLDPDGVRVQLSATDWSA